MKRTERSLPRCALVFDLDGVIVNTRLAVEAAYHTAGIKMPPDAWGRPWREWCDNDTHRKKNLAYPTVLREHGHPGPLMWLIVKLRGEALVLTGASPDAVNIIRRTFDIDFKVLGYEQTREQKYEKLSALARNQQVVYFDDDRRVVNNINDTMHSNLTAILVKGEN